MRITLIHSGALGDTVLLLPLLRALRAKHPGARLTLVMRPAFAQMLEMWGEAHAWHSIDDAACSRWFTSDAGAEPLSWSDCDLLLSAVSTGHDAWAHNARRLSTATDVVFFNPRPPADYLHHVTDFHREQLAALGLPEVPHVPIAHNPDGAIIFHPGSGGESKCWPRENYLALARDLKRNGLLPTFILGEAEQERWGREIIEALQAEFPWYLHMGLYELSQRLRRARLYLGNDSGVSHLAAAVGIPTLTLFGPSSDTQWRPHGPAVTILRSPTDPQNLATLPVTTVLDALLAELRKL